MKKTLRCINYKQAYTGGCKLVFWIFNPFLPTVAFNICCPKDCVSRHNGGDDSDLRALSSLRGLRRYRSPFQQMLERWAKIGRENATVGKNWLQKRNSGQKWVKRTHSIVLRGLRGLTASYSPRDAWRVSATAKMLHTTISHARDMIRLPIWGQKTRITKLIRKRWKEN